MLSAALIVVVCLACSACFSGFENGMIAVRKARLDHAVRQGSRRARLMKYFLDRPGLMLATILLGNNLVNTFASIYFDQILGQAAGLAGDAHRALLVLAASALMTVILLLVGEITPKVWFRQQPFTRSRMLVFPMYAFHLAMYPFVRALTILVASLNRVFPSREHRSDAALVREEFRIMLRESVEEGLIDHEAGRLLDNALDFHRRRIGDLMTPLHEVITIPHTMTLAEAAALAQKTKLARFPVYRAGEDTGGWIGVFSVYDALYNVPPEHWAKGTVLKHVRPPISIDADAPISQLLPHSRAHRSPLLIVLDAHKRPAGIITINDIVQPLFGEFAADQVLAGPTTRSGGHGA